MVFSFIPSPGFGLVMTVGFSSSVERRTEADEGCFWWYLHWLIVTKSAHLLHFVRIIHFQMYILSNSCQDGITLSLSSMANHSRWQLYRSQLQIYINSICRIKYLKYLCMYTSILHFAGIIFHAHNLSCKDFAAVATDQMFVWKSHFFVHCSVSKMNEWK